MFLNCCLILNKVFYFLVILSNFFYLYTQSHDLLKLYNVYIWNICSFILHNSGNVSHSILEFLHTCILYYSIKKSSNIVHSCKKQTRRLTITLRVSLRVFFLQFSGLIWALNVLHNVRTSKNVIMICKLVNGEWTIITLLSITQSLWGYLYQSVFPRSLYWICLWSSF